MIQTQFQTHIQTLRTDNGTEYFNTTMGDFLQSHGIIHQSSCVDSPQQNGIAERKNRHLLEVARALMFTSNMPKMFWGDAILTSTFLINRMPSRTLNFKSPLSKHFKHFFLLAALAPTFPYECLAVLPLFMFITAVNLILELLNVFYSVTLLLKRATNVMIPPLNDSL